MYNRSIRHHFRWISAFGVFWRTKLVLRDITSWTHYNNRLPKNVVESAQWFHTSLGQVYSVHRHLLRILFYLLQLSKKRRQLRTAIMLVSCILKFILYSYSMYNIFYLCDKFFKRVISLVDFNKSVPSCFYPWLQNTSSHTIIITML